MALALKQAVCATLAIGFGTLTASCSASKVSQCNQLIEVANSAVESVQTVTTTSEPQDVNAMIQIADTADQATTEMQALELPDEQLKAYQGRFVTMYAETSRASRALVAAVNEKNTQAAEEAYSALQTATGQEAPLVEEVNTYCQQE